MPFLLSSFRTLAVVAILFSCSFLFALGQGVVASAPGNAPLLLHVSVAKWSNILVIATSAAGAVQVCVSGVLLDTFKRRA